MICIVIVESEWVKFIDRLEIWFIFIFGVKFSLKWVIIGFGKIFMICVWIL